MINTLKKTLAETYALYLKTQTYHWNVTGPHFPSYHGMFENQYQSLANAVDQLAERLRALGHTVPASFGFFEKLSTINTDVLPKDVCGMIFDLIKAHETLAQTLATLIQETLKAKDPVTADLATERLAYHEKTLWLLKATL